MTFGPTSVRVVEPFGLFSQERRFKERTSVLVYPRIRPIPDLMTTSAQHLGSSPAAGAWADYPPETGGVRRHAAGGSLPPIPRGPSPHHNPPLSESVQQ